MVGEDNNVNFFSDFLIVGAGPAGVQMAYFLEKAGRDYVVLEASATAGSFYSKFPRQRTMISINKRFNYFSEADFNLRHDWNSLLSDDPELLFTHYSKKLYPDADDIVTYISDFCEKFHLKIKFNHRVVSIKKDDQGNFVLKTRSGDSFGCRWLLMATGAVKPHMAPEIKGIDQVEGYHDYVADPSYYENKRVAIIGRGNSAFEVANSLAGHAAIINILVEKKVKHAWETHFVGDLRAINNTILDMYQLKSLHATVGFRVIAVEKNASGSFTLLVEEDLPHWKKPGTTRTRITYDHVICCTGWKFIDMDIFQENIRPEMDAKNKYPKLDPAWESSVPGLFFIGTAMAARDRKAASGFIHGFRYNIRTCHRLLENRFFGRELPRKTFALTNERDLSHLAQFLIHRLSTVSALYQMNGYLCDALVLEGNNAHLYFELPKDFVLQEQPFCGLDQLNIITLEYGFHKYPENISPLDFIHPADSENVGCSAFLHPVIRLFQKGDFRDEVILGESLVVRYDFYDYEENVSDVHKHSLMNFFNRQCKVSDKVFDEEKYLDGTHTPWPENRVKEVKAQLAEQKTPCKFMI